MILHPNQALVVNTPGAGGYGASEQRDPALLDEDYRSGKFSAEAMRQKYGYVGDKT